MRTLRNASAVIGIVLVFLFVSFAVARTTRARADAVFIAAANLQTVTLTVDGVDRRALVHLPPAYDGKVALPVVLMFHGNGGTAESVVKETGWVAKSDAAGFIVVFPEATRPDMTQPPKFGRNNPAWNDGSGRFHAGERNITDVAFIAALLDHIEAKFDVDKRRVFATGFNGVPEKAKPPVREMVQAWVKLLGCKEEAESIASDIEGITTIVHTGGRDGTEVVFTTIKGHGHIWPGGKSPLPAFILGKATSRLNANDAVWDFFQSHPKPNP